MSITRGGAVRRLSGRGGERAQWAGPWDGPVGGGWWSTGCAPELGCWDPHKRERGTTPRSCSQTATWVLWHECTRTRTRTPSHVKREQSFKGVGVGWSFSFLKWYLFVCVTMSVCTCVHVCQGAHEEVGSTFGSGSLSHLWRLRGSCLWHAVWSRLTQAFRDPEDQTQAARPVRQAHFPFPLGCLPTSLFLF